MSIAALQHKLENGPHKGNGRGAFTIRQNPPPPTPPRHLAARMPRHSTKVANRQQPDRLRSACPDRRSQASAGDDRRVYRRPCRGGRLSGPRRVPAHVSQTGWHHARRISSTLCQSGSVRAKAVRLAVRRLNGCGHLQSRRSRTSFEEGPKASRQQRQIDGARRLRSARSHDCGRC